MATPILSNLGTQSTYKVYICDGDGAKGSSNGILANLKNTTDIRRILLEHAAQNRALVYESTTFGYTNQELDGTASAYKYFLSDGNGVEGTVTADALDITPYITNGYKTALYPDANDLAVSATLDSVSSGVYTYERRGNIQVLKIDTQSNSPTDDLFRIQEINGQIADKDILIIIGTSVSRAITIYDYDKGLVSEVPAVNKNIDLEGKSTFATTKPESKREKGDFYYDNSSLTLMYDSATSLWIEINRAPNNVISRKTLRDAEINLPIDGTTNISLVSTGGAALVADSSGKLDDGGVRRVQSGVDSSLLIFTGTVSTANNYTVEKPFGSALEGDKYTAIWKSNWSKSSSGGSNKVTIFGKELSSLEASTGATNAIEITTRYVNGEWLDGIKKIDSGAFEPTLSNPSEDGMVLESTKAGVRSWGRMDGKIYKKFTYDFSIDGGTVSSIALGNKAMSNHNLPAKAIIDASSSYIVVETVLTSEGDATVEVGLSVAATSAAYLSSDTNFFNGATAFTGAPFNAVGDVVTGLGNIGQLQESGKVTFTINGDALTGGKVSIYVAYINAG